MWHVSVTGGTEKEQLIKAKQLLKNVGTHEVLCFSKPSRNGHITHLLKRLSERELIEHKISLKDLRDTEEGKERVFKQKEINHHIFFYLAKTEWNSISPNLQINE